MEIVRNIRKSIQMIVDEVVANEGITDGQKRLEVAVRLLESTGDQVLVDTVDKLKEYGAVGEQSFLATEYREYLQKEDAQTKELTDEDRESIRSATTTYGGY